MSQEQVYSAAGFGAAVPRGTRPAVVVVDFSYGFTDLQYPTASDASAQMARTRQICDLARAKGHPVIFSTIAYHPGEVDKLPWLKKATGMAALIEGTRLVEIDAATGIQPQDAIVVKKGASSFFGSTLAALLAGANVDTLIVTGATTSGCVRATVVDAVQSGFNVLVPADCCADRAQAPHDANLYDMNQKYADVTDAADILAWLKGLA
ncbi:isochorismatase family protein [Paracoccus shanxieyensis]|uniref:Isochorismatase family protein n=1 Tax=Paracoccus shanxieyensis TaxID=2675752 RepID=A0A6L6IWU7_9RHOB|nr:isochorismatase family protein [Paracoccus shanxieyensis]MTH64088.1 isochorismatase family protein [Paracoccus shanxieyensis]MTH86871.1 isochorismatase family protein [Paracoccus shanxieyensis]